MKGYSRQERQETAIVTGGASGIGFATAAALLKKGWNVMITGRRELVLAQACRDLADLDPRKDLAAITYHVGDVSNELDVISAFDDAVEKYGSVDLLFANAGVGAAAKPIDELELSEWQAVVDTNLTGTFLCAREAFRVMKEQGGGRIIINGSISAMTPRPNSAPYTATKHALTGLTKSLSLDGRAHSIAVSQIDIGNASTPLTARMENGPGVPQADGSIRTEPTFNVSHAADQIVLMASLPLDVNIQFVTIAATTMPSFIGRG